MPPGALGPAFAWLLLVPPGSSTSPRLGCSRLAPEWVQCRAGTCSHHCAKLELWPVGSLPFNPEARTWFPRQNLCRLGESCIILFLHLA